MCYVFILCHLCYMKKKPEVFNTIVYKSIDNNNNMFIATTKYTKCKKHIIVLTFTLTSSLIAYRYQLLTSYL